MKVETLLPLGKIDPGLRAAEIPLDIGSVYEQAQLVERLGYDGLGVEETKVDPYVVLALAAQATTMLGLTTAVAMAFPRSPTITALSAWTLQKLSAGRLTLGLGSQVKGHIRRRYGMEWHPPAPWMRDYVKAMRAVWHCWQSGEELDYAGEHYQLNLMVPLFNPGPIDHPDVRVHLAAVNPVMCQVAGEVADGVRPHPVCTPKYIREVMLPAVAKGAEKAGRDAAAVEVAIKPLICTAPDQAALDQRIPDVRARVAFYCSTPAYRRTFEVHGLGDLAAEMSVLSREQRWDEMPDMISDEILHTYAVVGTYDEIAGKLKERYGDLVTGAEFSIPVQDADDEGRLREILTELKRA